MSDVLGSSVLHGLALGAVMTVVTVASLRQNPLIWLDDAPPDVRKRFGPIDARTRREKRTWGIVVAVALVATFAHLVAGVHHLGTFATFVAAYVAFQTFNLYDALVIDVPLVVLRPHWAFPDGAADAPSYRDARWHVRNWLVGVVGGVPLAGLVALLGWVGTWWMGRTS